MYRDPTDPATATEPLPFTAQPRSIPGEVRTQEQRDAFVPFTAEIIEARQRTYDARRCPHPSRADIRRAKRRHARQAVLAKRNRPEAQAYDLPIPTREDLETMSPEARDGWKRRGPLFAAEAKKARQAGDPARAARLEAEKARMDRAPWSLRETCRSMSEVLRRSRRRAFLAQRTSARESHRAPAGRPTASTATTPTRAADPPEGDGDPPGPQPRRLTAAPGEHAPGIGGAS